MSNKLKNLSLNKQSRLSILPSGIPYYISNTTHRNKHVASHSRRVNRQEAIKLSSIINDPSLVSSEDFKEKYIFGTRLNKLTEEELEDQKEYINIRGRKEMKYLKYYRYTWNLLTKRGIKIIKNLNEITKNPIFEINAGNGFIARLLSENNIDVIASDILDNSNITRFKENEITPINKFFYHIIKESGLETVFKNKPKILLSSRPRNFITQVFDEFVMYGGEIFIYMGDPGYYCHSAPENFFELVKMYKWNKYKIDKAIYNWEKIDKYHIDQMIIYTRPDLNIQFLNNFKRINEDNKDNTKYYIIRPIFNTSKYESIKHIFYIIKDDFIELFIGTNILNDVKHLLYNKYNLCEINEIIKDIKDRKDRKDRKFCNIIILNIKNLLPISVEYNKIMINFINKIRKLFIKFFEYFKSKNYIEYNIDEYINIIKNLKLRIGHSDKILRKNNNL